jgi:methyltransferase (TIGR00027 family)
MNTLGKTALGMAAVRAAESKREDRLFDDPYAQLFLDAMPFRLANGGDGTPSSDTKTASVGTLFASHATIRTRFFDEYLLGSGCRQIVLLAAGLDTRAFRLAWPSETRLFELDLPNVLEFKETVLAGHEAVCERVTLPVDLRDNWPAYLATAGFDPAEPTTWLAEGLLIYLSTEEATDLLTAICDLSAPTSRLAFERSDGPLATQARATPSMAEFTKLWKSSPGQDFSPWLTAHGWQVEIHRDVTYGRPATGNGFLTAQFGPKPERDSTNQWDRQQRHSQRK